MTYLMVIGGFALLFGGGEFLVRGAVAVSRRMNISPLLIGMTVVAFCTSAPELVVSVQSALQGNPDIAVGNVVGSNICNIALILGLAAVLKPISVHRVQVRPDTIMMIAACALLVVLGFFGAVERWQGALMVTVLVAYIVVQYRREMRAGTAAENWHVEEAAEFKARLSVPQAIGLLFAGLVALVFGSQLLVDGATSLAAALGVPDAVVGLTVVALGTSLPELATSAVAAVRGHSEVAVGNVVGSNTFNALAILGTTAVVQPVTISSQMARIDIPLMLAACAFAGAVLLVSGRFGRVFGASLVAAYVVYIVFLYTL